MKKYLYLLTVVFLITITFSCRDANHEEQLIGKWDLDSLTIDNLKEVVEYLIEKNIEELDGRRLILEENILTAENEDKKQNFELALQDLSIEKENITYEIIEKDILEHNSQEIQYYLKEDNVFINVISNKGGNWTVKDNKITLTLNDVDEQLVLEIQEHKKDNLLVTSEMELGEISMLITMKFSKIE